MASLAALCACVTEPTVVGFSEGPVLTDTPEVRGACCTAQGCSQADYDQCTLGLGGVWADVASCDAAPCDELLALSVPTDGAEGGEEDEEDFEEALSEACLDIIVCYAEDCGLDPQCGLECLDEVDDVEAATLFGAVLECAIEVSCADEDCLDEECWRPVDALFEYCLEGEDEGEEEGEGDEEVACCLANEGVCETLPAYLCEESGGQGTVDADCAEVCPDLDELTEAEYSACCFEGVFCEALPPRICEDEDGEVFDGMACADTPCRE